MPDLLNRLWAAPDRWPAVSSPIGRVLRLAAKMDIMFVRRFCASAGTALCGWNLWWNLSGRWILAACGSVSVCVCVWYEKERGWRNRYEEHVYSLQGSVLTCPPNIQSTGGGAGGPTQAVPCNLVCGASIRGPPLPSDVHVCFWVMVSARWRRNAWICMRVALSLQ